MELSSTALKKTLLTFLRRYHVVIYVVIVAGGLTGAILSLYGIVGSSSKNDSYTSPAASTTFDKATIDRVNQLKGRDQNLGTIDFPSGRTNPFIE